MKDYEQLGNSSIGFLLAKYSIPAVIGMLVNALYNVVDRIFIGNIPDVGSLAIAGLGVSLPIMTMILAFSMLVGLGTATNLSIKLGEGDKKTAEKLIGNAIAVGLVLGLTITIVGLIFMDKILYLFGASINTIAYAREYLKIIMSGAVFSIISFTLYHGTRVDGKPALASGIMITGAITNILLDYIMIFKFNLGISGAAYATVISQFITALIPFLYFYLGKSNLAFKISDIKIDTRLTKIVFAVGVSPFSMQLAGSTVQILSNNALMKHGGDLAIGAMTTVISIVMMLLMPIFGLNQGGQPIIGFNYGAHNGDRVLKTYKISVTIAFIFLVFGLILTRVYPYEIISIFNKDPELAKISTDALKKNLMLIPVAAINVTGSNFAQSIGKAKISMFLSLLRQVILLIPFMIILPSIFGLNGVWFSQPIADVISSIITIIVLKKQFKMIKDGKYLHRNVKNEA